MKNFIEIIKKNDKKITNSFENKELNDLDNMQNDLEDQHQEIKKNLKEVNYLLDLIEKHNKQIKTSAKHIDKNKKDKNWLEKIKDDVEKTHLLNTNELSFEDIEFLKKEKSKLLFEKERLEKEHYHIHQLIAKAKIFSMSIRNDISEEITKGHDIATVGEKLLEHFGKELKDGIDYSSGRRKMMKYLEELFAINRIQAKKLVDLLEESKVINYKTDYSKIITIPEYDDFLEFTNLNYTPLFGIWYINA